MKKLILSGIIVFLFPSGLALAQTVGSFSTTWNTANAGVSTSTQITIPTTGTGYNYDIYWEDTASSTINGTLTNNLGNVTIDFPAEGIYRVDITGDFPRIYFNNSGDRLKILTVEQWGTIAWTSMQSAFYGAANLQVTATDAPDLSAVDTMTFMFANATNFNSNINHWDVSNVTNMRRLFYLASSYDQPLDNWNVSNVTDFRDVFFGTIFNRDISMWDTGKGITFVGMFMLNSAFNQPLNAWNIASSTSLGSVFRFASAFDQPLDQWNVSQVSNLNNLFIGSGLSRTNYSDLLVGWSNLPTLVSGLTLDVTATANGAIKYEPYASTSRQLLIDTYGWNISDGGEYITYNATYNTQVGGNLVGLSTQLIEAGQNTSEVEAVADEGFIFVGWSDARTDNPRQDIAVAEDIAVTALFERDAVNKSSGTRVGRVLPRVKNSQPIVTVQQQVESLLVDRYGALFLEHDFSQPLESVPKRVAVISLIVLLMEDVLLKLQQTSNY